MNGDSNAAVFYDYTNIGITCELNQVCKCIKQTFCEKKNIFYIEMEPKTISGSLSAIDFAIVENVRLLSTKNLEDIHNHLLQFRHSGYLEDNIALIKVLEQINCIIDNYSTYEDDDSFHNEYVELRKLIIDWVIVYNTKVAIDDHE